MPNGVPAIRCGIEDSDGRTYIEIDEKKGKWPFLHFEWVPNEERWTAILDSNRDPAIGGQQIGLLKLNNKRMRALRDFLCEVDLDDA